MKLAFCLLWIGSAFSVLIPASTESEVCVDGCTTIALSVGDFVVLQAGSATSCTACGGGTTIAYKIIKGSACGSTNLDQGTFCTTVTGMAGNYEVQSIGSGCTTSPQGCVRLCSCI